MLRIALFLGTNIAILAVLSIVIQATGLEQYLYNETGINMLGLLVFSAAFGMIGAFISLALSKFLAKRSTGAKVIEQPSNTVESWLVNTVSRQAKEAGIGMPEVAIYPSKDINAFATGMNKNKALVAVSAGLLERMNQEEAEAVLAHEVSHIANGDMVTMTLVQGVLNTFVIFFSRIIGMFVDRVIFKVERGYGPGYFVVSIIAQIILGILASMIVMWFSRKREFRADAGGARLAGKQKMTAALEKLKTNVEVDDLPKEVKAFGIAGGIGSGMKKLFMSHPPLEERIKALQNTA